MTRYDPFAMAEEKGIHVRYVDFQEAPLGLTTTVNGEQFILLSDLIEECRMRYFVCAHELYHCMEHEGLTSYYMYHHNSKNKLEREANQFAIQTITNLYLDRFDKEGVSIYDVLDYFHVPKEVYGVVG